MSKNHQIVELRKKRAALKRRTNSITGITSIILVLVLIYVAAIVFLYFQKQHIARYEVKKGSLSTENTYRGLILRDEMTVRADNAGYVNYMVAENERVGKYDAVYMLDETGRLNEELMKLEIKDNALSEGELNEFRSDLINYSHSFDCRNYSSVYEFEKSMTNSVSKLHNAYLLKHVNDSGELGTDLVSVCTAPETGNVSLWYDNLEDITPENVNSALFDESNYEKTVLEGNSLVAGGDVVYKVCGDENWSVIFPIERSRGATLLEEGYIKIKFLKNQYESWAGVDLLDNPDGNSYLKLNFNNSCITFLNDRFIDVELLVDSENGLKIPNSSIAQKEFYLIPSQYVIAKEENSYGILKQSYNDDGNPYVSFNNVEIYSFDAEADEYYLDSDTVNAGDILYMEDNVTTFTVGKKATLTGVYNINKGYADFKEINVLYSNDEYSIVKANTTYGLNVYDYIVLDAQAVTDDQIINK
ncbi:MAG: hypothetical protein K6F84_00985 [Lachnospiraceae bacterium]|nr:hypothetical protein [Lachnospiraceae bacterium]